MVEFNRRFSPLTQRLKKVLAYRKSPLSIIIIVNADSVPMDSWVQDPGV
jgi:predicted dehydrogenase